MRVYLEREDKEIELEFIGTVFDLLKQLKINHMTVVVDVNGVVVEFDYNLFDKDKVRILDVVTGG